jgi:tripartite-type tricarboxylate transporter receptor subunit TctC
MSPELPRSSGEGSVRAGESRISSAAIVDRYNKVVNDILASSKVRESLEKQGLTALGGPPERLGQLIARDQPRWAKVVKDAGITAE